MPLNPCISSHSASSLLLFSQRLSFPLGLFSLLTMGKHYRPPGKKKEGNAARYITRSQAVKHLQVNLPVFRKLCILKGVFPREPKKKVKGNHHTYYHLKDIAFLHHEPLLETFRETRVYEKKIKKAKAKKNEERAKRLEKSKPNYKLDRLIRERYPKFLDAIRDLDDCLTMVHLFAALPALEREKIEVRRVHNCRRLSHEWQAYISRTHKLRKVFVSVKGIYYQAEVQGQKVTWLTPHALQQVLSEDIDYNVMLTYLEFNETLLAFVNCHLYHSINVKYPPILDSRLEALAADLYALSRWFAASSRALVDPQASSVSGTEQGQSQHKETSAEESELRLAQLQQQLPSNEPGALMHLVEDVAGEDEEDEDTKECKKLFKNMKFFLSREVPRESLLFVIPAFGGMVSWEGDGAPYDENDEDITHQIVDRPSQTRRILSRDYVQPQWVFDSVNARIILPTEDYLVGRIPPPHLSPFVDNDAEGYVPDYAETIKRLQAAAKNQVLPLPGVGEEDMEDPQSLLAEGVIDRAEANEAAERKRKMTAHQMLYNEEIEKELRSSTSIQTTSVEKMDVGEEPLPDLQQVVEDTTSMSKVMMSRKKRGLLEAITKGKQRKKDQINLLKERKRKVEEGQKSN